MSLKVQPKLARDLLKLYLTNPTLVETTEGLARWRLADQLLDKTIRETEQALEWLVSRGFLRQISGRRGRTVFMMNPDRRDEAQHWIGRGSEERHGRT
jgi:hypothetical protein